MVDFRIDSHKLTLHPARVTQWLAGEIVYPITVEISPSGACNHRCQFCAFDYLEYKPVFLERELILNNLQEMAQKGVKSIVVAGEGEPLLNPATPEFITQSVRFGLDVAMSSNAVLFTREVAEECLSALTWVRFSVNAGSDTTYDAIHRGKKGDFARVLSNLRSAVEVKQRRKLKTTIGVQLLLIPDNSGEVLAMARTLKEIGVDYFTVKPYSQHPKSINVLDAAFDYQPLIEMEQEINELSNESYRVLFRSVSMNKLHKERQYDCCRGLPFWAYIASDARIWACLAYVGNEDFCYGNLQEQGFAAIWEGEQRAKLMAKVEKMDVSDCRELCRLDEINAYLHNLKKPGGHDNFI